MRRRRSSSRVGCWGPQRRGAAERASSTHDELRSTDRSGNHGHDGSALRAGTGTTVSATCCRQEEERRSITERESLDTTGFLPEGHGRRPGHREPNSSPTSSHPRTARRPRCQAARPHQQLEPNHRRAATTVRKGWIRKQPRSKQHPRTATLEVRSS